MTKRKTISLNQNYLKLLKLLSIKKDKSLSEIINEAVRLYLSKVQKRKENKLLFNKLNKFKADLNLSKKELKAYIEKGRL